MMRSTRLKMMVMKRNERRIRLKIDWKSVPERWTTTVDRLEDRREIASTVAECRRLLRLVPRTTRTAEVSMEDRMEIYCSSHWNFVADREILLNNWSKVWRIDYSTAKVKWAFLSNRRNKRHALRWLNCSGDLVHSSSFVVDQRERDVKSHLSIAQDEFQHLFGAFLPLPLSLPVYLGHSSLELNENLK